MYTPPSFMTLEVVSEVVSQFDWPASYTLEDDLPDGVVMEFPGCRLFFVEGFEGEISIKFLPRDTGLKTSLTMAEALLGLRSAQAAGVSSGPKLDLFNDRSPRASLDKVKHGLHDQCVIVLAHFRDCLLGDFSWVETYKTYYARKQRPT